MGLIALILSVVVDAIWPLRGRPQALSSDEEVRDRSLDDDAADPLAEVPYDPLSDSAAGGPSSAQAASAAPAVPYLAHPLERYALRLIDWMADDASVDGGVRRHLSVPGWLVVVGIPVVLVVLAQAILGAVAGLLVFALHVAVLYLTVGLGAFHRQFSELQLLIGAGEERSARLVLARWMAAGSAGLRAADAAGAEAAPADHPSGSDPAGATGTSDAGTSDADSALPLAGVATAHAVLAAYRDVFAPLFWYAVLPGAIGPVLYLFARFAACHSLPFARIAYYWLDWIPLRLASLGFALVGQFEDTIFCLRAVGAIRAAIAATGDAYLHQRLLLLPVAGGALGCRLTDAGVDAQLRMHALDLDLPGFDQEASSLRGVSGLLLRSGVVWVGIYLLANLLD